MTGEVVRRSSKASRPLSSLRRFGAMVRFFYNPVQGDIIVIDLTNHGPKSRILPPNLNNNWIMAVIGRSRHMTG